MVVDVDFQRGAMRVVAMIYGRRSRMNEEKMVKMKTKRAMSRSACFCNDGILV